MVIIPTKNEAIQFLKSNVAEVVLGGAGVVALGTGAVAVARSVSRRRATKKKSVKTAKRTTKRRTKKTTKKRAKPKKKCSRKYARTAGKGKDTSTRRIRMTKNGQPYIILASGKAKFISKKSACLSRKRKGGRY